MGRVVDDFVTWFAGGMIYFYFEILFRGYSHYSMIICGGLCVLIVGRLGKLFFDSFENKFLPIILIMLFGSIIITSLEYVTGIIVNVELNNCVWDYSERDYNVSGQICLEFSALWSALSLLCVAIDDIVRRVMRA